VDPLKVFCGKPWMAPFPTGHDLNATILGLLGFDHTRLTYRHQGRDFRVTDVHGHVVEKLLA